MRDFQKKWNNSIESDKQAHFLIGVLCGLLSFLVFVLPYEFSVILTLMVINVVGYGIELYQGMFTENRHVEAADAYAVCAGGGFSMLVVLLGHFILF